MRISDTHEIIDIDPEDTYVINIDLVALYHVRAILITSLMYHTPRMEWIILSRKYFYDIVWLFSLGVPPTVGTISQ